MEDSDLKFFIEGSRVHRGNVLAHVLVAKLNKLISALNQFDRKQGGVSQRRADYEVVEAKKYNPTEFTLHPVARVAGFDAAAVMQWSFGELEAVAAGADVDERVDYALAQTLAELSDIPGEIDDGKMWLKLGKRSVSLDQSFRANSLLLAGRRAAIDRPAAWREGASLGSVVGYLSQVGDLEGATKLVITPKIGPDKVECVVRDDDRELVKAHLWTTVRVSGLLHYSEKSPFPFSVDMEEIHSVAQPGRHLLEMRGIFKGKPRENMTLDGLLHG